MAKHTILHEGSLSPDQESTYVHLPFDMPAEATQLEVEYQYSNPISSDPLITGGNTIDLGIFDEGGIEFLKAGFRGWSGSNRKNFFITEDQATPGYLAGPLNPGRWNILLGLYKIAPHGCTFQVTITITTLPGHDPAGMTPRIARDLSARSPAEFTTTWLRGELHCHTHHSDGSLSATDLLELARSRGMDFLAITDHNTTACQHKLEETVNPGLILLRGLEVTTFKGHFNIWGIPDWVDFRIQKPEDMEAALQYANQLGAVTSCNHPKLFGPPWDYPEVSNFQSLEVWNGPWSGLDEMALEYWLSLLETGRRVPAVGGSDFHKLSEGERNIGTPTNWVYIPDKPDPANILKAIRRGHVSLSDEPDGPFLDLRSGEDNQVMGGDVLALANNQVIRLRCQRGIGCQVQIFDQGAILFEREVHKEDETIEWALQANAKRYIRAELRAANGRLRALTNPIYLS